MNSCSYIKLRLIDYEKSLVFKIEERRDCVEKEKIECCEFLSIHEDIIQKVQEQMPDEEVLYDLAELYKVFGDSTRMKIMYVLFASEMCVCDIAQLLNMSQSAISHQLRVLKQSKLVKARREGKVVFYSLADDHVRTIVDQGMEHILEDRC